MMKHFVLLPIKALFCASLLIASCSSKNKSADDGGVPPAASNSPSSPFPAELLGSWVVTGFSATTFSDPNSTATLYGNEYYLGYTFTADGKNVKEIGHVATYDGTNGRVVTKWTKWGTARITGEVTGSFKIEFFPNSGNYTISRNGVVESKTFKAAELYPNKSFTSEDGRLVPSNNKTYWIVGFSKEHEYDKVRYEKLG